MGIKNILEIFIKAYRELYASGRIKSTMTEPEISEELFVELQFEWRRANISLVIIPEKSHRKNKKSRGKTPTIDFCFRGRWDSLSYFGFECKLLKEGDNKLNSLYITEGVNRYISGKYSKNYPIGAMIGYETYGTPTKIIHDIKQKVNKVADIAKMKKSNLISNFSDHYFSLHSRNITGHSSFQLYHLFFDFT